MPPSREHNDQRVVEILWDGAWHYDDEFTAVGVRLGPALQRCLQAGLVERRDDDTDRTYRITDAGIARLSGQEQDPNTTTTAEDHPGTVHGRHAPGPTAAMGTNT